MNQFFLVVAHPLIDMMNYRDHKICASIAGSNPDESIDVNSTVTQKLISRFEGQYGSINCRQLIGFDLATKAGQLYFMENHLIERCIHCAADASSMAVLLIDESHQ